MQARPQLTNLGAAELELFKEIQHGRGVDEGNDPYVRDNVVALSGSKDCSSRAPGRPDFNPVVSVAFSPDGALLATGSFDGKIYIYDVETEEQRVEIDVQSSIDSLAWAPDSSVLAAGSPGTRYSPDGVISQAGAATYDAKSGAVVQTFEIEEVAFSPDGAMLAVAEKTSTDSRNGRVAIYLRSPDDAPVREPAPSPTPRPTLMPTSRLTFRPTSSPRDESDGARTASMAWAALLLVAWLA